MVSSASVTPLGGGLLIVLALAGCGAPPTPTDHDDHDHDHPSTSGIVLTPGIEANLGITWATAEERVVRGVLRLPGRFESEPEARRTYQAPLAGRVTVVVRPYQRVEAGQVLARLTSPAWHTLRQQLAEGCADGCADGCGTMDLARQRLREGEAQVAALRVAVGAWEDRLTALRALDPHLGGNTLEKAEAAAGVADQRVALLEAEQRLTRLRRDATGPDGALEHGQAAQRLRSLLAQASAVTGLTVEELAATDAKGLPRWSTIDELDIRARRSGVVEAEVVLDGGWVEAQGPLLTVNDPTGVRFRAQALQGDLPRLREDLTARIVAADPQVREEIPSTFVLAPQADPVDRTVDLIARPSTSAPLPTWVRPGVTAALEVVISGSPTPDLAIPVAATIRDGLTTILFRRDPSDPNRLYKIEADLGASDGRWIVVQSGLRTGDEVVLGGIYPLKLSQQSGGVGAAHVHADGTVHTGAH
jgi:hypothetical protein